MIGLNKYNKQIVKYIKVNQNMLEDQIIFYNKMIKEWRLNLIKKELIMSI